MGRPRPIRTGATAGGPEQAGAGRMPLIGFGEFALADKRRR
jgi:hypothetical protein